MRLLLAALVLSLTASRSRLSTLVVSVVEDVTRRSLPNAEVIDLDSGMRWFTNERGEARVIWPGSQRLHLRVRQIGFTPAERTIEPNASERDADSLTIVLKRVAFALPEVVTRDVSRCDVSTDSLVSLRAVPALEQLRFSAERYGSFRKVYPFHIQQERRTITVNMDGTPKAIRQNTEDVDSERWGEPYVPKDIIRREPLGFSIPILHISALADPLFLARHCFSAPGIEELHGERVVRLEFAPATGIKGPEWRGAAFIDSATSILRRVEFRLIGLPEDDRPRRFEGYTTFRSPSPFVAIPDSTVAMWWHDGPREPPEWGRPNVVQLIRVLQFRYRKGAPP